MLVLPLNATSVVTTSNVGDSEVSFVSTKYPTSDRVYSSLMKLVMKSLSVEVTADPQKPVFFGDGASGSCLSRIFNLQDTHARGRERKYALIVACDSETDLIENWEIIGNYFMEIITLVQAKVNARLKELLNNNMVDHEHYLRRSKNMPKALTELTGDPETYMRFHLWAVQLLKDLG